MVVVVVGVAGGRDGGVNVPAVLLRRVEEGDDMFNGEESQRFGGAGGGFDRDRGEGRAGGVLA